MVDRRRKADQLRDCVIGRDASMSRGQAFAVLATTSRPDRESLLASVIRDPAERSSTRTAAAIALGRIETRDAEQLLIQCIKAVDHRTLQEVLRSLGHIGRLDALAAIESLRLPPSHPAGEAARFATTLIAHRFGLEGRDWHQPSPEQFLPPPEQDFDRMDVQPSPAEHSRQVLADLGRYPHGVQLDPNRMLLVHCGGNVNTLCMNSEFANAESVHRIRDRKTLLGIVALQSPESGHHSVCFLILTAPSQSGDEINIMVPRCSGKLALAGSTHLVAGGIQFALRSIRWPGSVAMDVQGTLRFDGSIALTTATASRHREPRRRPARAVDPRPMGCES
jgi:hypothetical protein